MPEARTDEPMETKMKPAPTFSPLYPIILSELDENVPRSDRSWEEDKIVTVVILSFKNFLEVFIT